MFRWLRGTRIAWALGVVHIVMVAIYLSPLMRIVIVHELFDVNGEGNLVVWLSSTTLLGLAGLATLFGARSDDRTVRVRWWIASGGFVLLSIDETAGLHERLGLLASRFMEVEWLPGAFLWVLVLGPFAAAAAVWLLVWLGRTLDWRTTAGRLAAAAILVWLTVPFTEALDPAAVGWGKWLYVAEEGAEALGEVLMLGALLSYRSRLDAQGVSPHPVPAQEASP